jgi:hypothetical protein
MLSTPRTYYDYAYASTSLLVLFMKHNKLPFSRSLATIWARIAPLYEQLHAHVRRVLATVYNPPTAVGAVGAPVVDAVPLHIHSFKLPPSHTP